MKKRYIISAFASLVFATPVFANYAIIVDAGSSGSRLHLFQYNLTGKGNIPDIKDIFSEKSKPSLSSFANNPSGAGASLKKSFDDALQEIQKDHVDPSAVSVSVLGTAGMRLLPVETQQAIYASVTNYLKSNYTFDVKNIKTIPGEMEGLYGWLDINYLKQNFQNHLNTVGSIDMGGASTEIAFATNNTSKPADEVTLKIGDQQYTIFSKSFRGLGQDESRAVINTDMLAYTCYPKDDPYSSSSKGNFNFFTCRSLYADFIQQHQIEQNIIMPDKNQEFIAYSAIYYTDDFFGMNEHPTQTDVENRIQTVCMENWSELLKNYPNVQTNYLSSDCADATYFDDLLYNTYRLDGARLTVADMINQQEIDWPLGALLYDLVHA